MRKKTFTRNHELFFFNLHKTQFDRSFPTENFHHNLELFFLIVYFLNDSTEATKRSMIYFHRLTHIIWNVEIFSGFLEFINFP